MVYQQVQMVNGEGACFCFPSTLFATFSQFILMKTFILVVIGVNFYPGWWFTLSSFTFYKIHDEFKMDGTKNYQLNGDGNFS